MTPTISMNPSAIRANSSPSEIPLMRCGRRLVRNSTSQPPATAYISYVGVASYDSSLQVVGASGSSTSFGGSFARILKMSSFSAGASLYVAM